MFRGGAIRHGSVALLVVLIFAGRLGSAELVDVSDETLIEEIDKTTMLGRMARGTWDWRVEQVGF